ncbi:MAG: anti-sigma factor family protein, partial [Anaerolineae bacterium]
MDHDTARRLIDAGGDTPADDAALEAHLAACPACRRQAMAEDVLAASLAGDSLAPSRQLQQALLAIPRRERRLHLLALLTVPMAGVACLAGAGVLALMLQGRAGDRSSRRAGPTAMATGLAAPPAASAPPAEAGGTAPATTPRPGGTTVG